MSQGATIDLGEKFAAIPDHWRPRVAARLNGQDVRLVKVQGVFPWHSHADAEEMFLVWKGRFRSSFATGSRRWGRASSSSCRAASSTARPPTRRPRC